MGKPKARIKPAGANALRNSSKITSYLKSKGESIAKMADARIKSSDKEFKNPNYVVRVRHSPERTHVSVIAANPHSINDNLKNNTLLKSLGSGGGSNAD